MFSLRGIVFRSVFQPSCSRTIRYVNKDPGIGRRKKLLEIEDIEDAENIDDLENYETDFMEVHKSHKEHMRELEIQKEKEKYYIVRQKYFKEKFPNFLTWHDKEQIRYLHRSNPEEWTVDRLSEGFPALPEIIFKLIKSNFAKKQTKITNHDAMVQNNWKLFKEGKLTNLSPDLVQHLNKFTNRALNFKPFIVPDNKTSTVQVKTKNIGTEFSDIITSYQKLKKKSSNNEEQQTTTSIESGTEIKEETEIKRGKSITFQELQLKVTDKINTGLEVDDEDTRIVTTTTERETKKDKFEMIDLNKNKYQSSTGVQYIKKENKDYSHLNYPEKIKIPKKLLKRGFTYKLNDCYYDDDGQFLYRVPGMS